MELSSGIRAIETGSNRGRTAESFSLPASAALPMIPEPHEPFDINRKEDSIFLLGSMFTVIFLFLL
ncbi:putative conserved membrane protein [Synechococcus sp. TAK9802]|nr:putative conserved membrane protein [Synechococcus sp. TAK9802]